MKIKAFGYTVAAICVLIAARAEATYGEESFVRFLVEEPLEEPLSPLGLQLEQQFGQQFSQQPELTEITNILIVEYDDGIDLLLEAPGGRLLAPFTAIDGNAFVADFDNTVLSLSTGENFWLESPATGVERIEVTQINPQQVQVRIVGSEVPPSTAISIDSQQLTISATGFSIGSESDRETAGESPADSADSDADSPLRLIVTAEKRPDEVQDVPISLTAFSAEEIEDDDITFLEEIAGSTPNFTAYTPGRNFLLYSIRGLSNLNFLSRDSAAFYIDDVPYDYTGFLDLDLSDLDQIEVLRGPQSTLYGRNAIAGVVNITTRKPTNEPEYRVSSSLGNFISPDIRASASGPIIEDNLFYRLSGDFKQREGFLINTDTGDDIDFESGGSGRAQLLWEPSDNWNLLLNASFNRYRDGTPPISRPDLGQDPSETDANTVGFNNLDTNAQSLSVNYENPSLRFTSITARRFSGQAFENDSDGTILDQFAQVVDIDSSTISQELRLQSAAEDGPFLWLVGAYFEDRDFNVNQDGLRLGVDAGGPSLSGASSILDEETYAVFGQASYRPIDPVTLTAGLRYEIFNTRWKIPPC
ncbi:TonB-dependent receptor domain-containing protein [cf. Phormidesmis sp. LEGE 11477]|uniref:TonB-dependent receptor domain-containing protein n=1 Tax=cf. Phormidesmis sp. LEGE 11477 TaxID=1828680 RepID=UPI0018809370|nr:TonB-dependent receptor [cf. Phormidesmis sp. LEGE 11477]MBE9062514.1 TonB-dependent receptor [cf. Phormidesmis sp. LEGE 11477]